jgi:hypothetical protein
MITELLVSVMFPLKIGSPVRLECDLIETERLWNATIFEDKCLDEDIRYIFSQKRTTT